MKTRKRRIKEAVVKEDDEGGSCCVEDVEQDNDAEEQSPPKKKAMPMTDVIRTVKTSLSKHLVRSSGTRDLLQPLLLYCNQIRVMATLVAKHHIFTTLQAPPYELSFVPNQNYFSRALTLSRGGNERSTEKMSEADLQSLKESAEHIRRLFPTPIYDGPLSLTGQTGIFSWYAKQLAENLSTHLTTHSGDIARNWLNNQIRSEILEASPHIEEEGGLKKAIRERKAAMRVGTANPSNDPLGLAFADLDNQISQMMESGKIGDKTRKLIAAFYSLQKEVCELDDRHSGMKLFSVMPEANIAISPITVDSTVMLELYKAIKYGKGKKWTKGTAPDDWKEANLTNWDVLFNMDEVRKLRNAPWEFSGTMTTDGVALSVRFEKQVKKAEHVEDDEYVTRKVDLNVPGLYGENCTFEEEQLATANLVGLDPGIKSIVTAVRLSDVDSDTLRLKDGAKSIQLSQAQYSEESMARYKLKNSGVLQCKGRKKRGRKRRPGEHGGRARRWRRRDRERTRQSYAYQTKLKKATEVLKAAPSSKRVDIAKYEEYLTALASVWKDMWSFHGTVKRRKIKFFVYRRREKFMNKLVMSFEQRFGPKPVILFGKGGENGLFASLRGCGVKGPVKEIKRRLSEKYAVVMCSEYRTSKLCIHCGREVHVHKHGVVYCTQQSHCSMLNRDVAAAIKIGALFLAKKKGVDLGPWAWGATIADHVPSTALASVIGHSA